MMLYTPDYGIESGFDFSITTEATDELVSFEIVKRRMNYGDDTNFNTEKDIIENQIKGVRIYLEHILGMSLVASKTITAYWKSYPVNLQLPYGPVQSVTSVSKIALSDGTVTALSSSEYWVEGVKNKSLRLNALLYGYGLKVVYVAGLSDTWMQDYVSDAILSEVIQWYHQRGNSDETQYVLGKIALSKLDIFRKL